MNTNTKTHPVEYTYMGHPGTFARRSRLMTVPQAHESIGSRVASGWGVVSYLTRTRDNDPVTVVGIVADSNGVWAIYVLPL